MSHIIGAEIQTPGNQTSYPPSHESGVIVITGADRIETARWLAVRSALKLETHGLKRRGRSARQLANDITGQNHRTAIKAYAALNDHIVTALGPDFNRPL
jgi:hypothetical protein